MSHARLSPSDKTWVHCDLAVFKNDAAGGRPDTPNPYSEEGVFLHQQAAKAFWRVRAGLTPTYDHLDDQQRAFVSGYVERSLAEVTDDTAWGFERKARLWYEPESKGTADFWRVAYGDLLVRDFKSGATEEQIDSQLKIYGLALYDRLKLFWGIRTITLHIDQPRIHNYPKEEFTVDELLEFKKEITKRADQLRTPTREATVGKHCTFCPWRTNGCNAVLATAASIKRPADQLTKRRRQAILDNKDLIRKVLADIEADALENIEDYPNHKLVLGRAGNRRYKNEEEFTGWASGKGLDPWETTLRSPNQFEKRYKTEIPKKFITRNNPKPQVVSKDDKRPAIQSIKERVRDLRSGEREG